VSSGRGLCDELITRPEESYRMWCVVCVWSRNFVNEEALAHWGSVATKNKQTNKKILRHLGMYLIWRMRLITNK